MAISLGSVEFGLGADTSGLQKSIDKLRLFGDEVDKVSRRQSASGQALAKAYQSQEKAITSALQKVVSFNNSASKVDGSTAAINAASAAWQKYSQYVSQAQRSAFQMQRANTQLNASLAGAQRMVNNLKFENAQSATSKISAGLRDISAAAILITGPLGGVATRITAFTGAVERAGLGMAAFVAGTAGVIFAVDKISKATLSAGEEVDDIKARFFALTGSAAAAAAAFNQVETIADRTGVSLRTLGEEYSRFQEATSGTSMQGAKGLQAFETIAELAGKLRMTDDQAKELFQTFELMATRGNATSREVIQRLGNELPGAMRLAAQSMNVTNQQFLEMLNNSQVLGTVLEDKLLSKIREFYNLNGSNVDSIAAHMERLKTAATNFFDTLDKGLGVSSGFKNTLDSITGGINYLTDNFKKLGEEIAAVTGFFIGLAAPAVIGGLITLGVRLKELALGVKEIEVAGAAASVVGGGGLLKMLLRLGLAAGTAAGAAYLVKKSFDDMDSSKGPDDLTKKVDDFISSSKTMGGAASDLGAILHKDLETRIQSTKDQLAELNQEMGATSGGGIKAAKFSTMTQKQADDYNTLYPEGDSFGGDTQRFAKAGDTLQVGMGNISGAVDQASDKTGAFTSQMKALQDQIDKDSDSLKRLDDALKPIKDEPIMTPAQLEAMEKMRLSTDKVSRSIQVLGTQGYTAFQQLQESFSFQDKVEAYEVELRKIYSDQDLINQKLQQFAQQQATWQIMEDSAKKTQTVINDLQTSVGNSTDNMINAFVKMAETGKINFKSLADAARQSADDIIQTFVKLAIEAPLKNYLFGQTGNNAAPTLEGAFQQSNSGGGVSASSLSIPAAFANAVFGRSGQSLQGYQGAGANNVSDLGAISGSRSIWQSIFGGGSNSQAAPVAPAGSIQSSDLGPFGSSANDNLPIGAGGDGWLSNFFSSSGDNAGAASTSTSGGFWDSLTSFFGGSGGGSAAVAGTDVAASSAGDAGGIASIFASIASLFGTGGVVAPMRAAQGMLTQPTLMATGMGPILGGEAGTEAVMPLTRDRSGNLGVRTSGGGQQRPVNVTITTPNPTSFAQSQRQVAQGIRKAVQYAGRGA